MKRFSIFVLIFLGVIAAYSSLSSAACSDADRIFRISGATNAHAAKYNEAGYSTEICFSDYFDGTINNPHSGTGVVLRLSTDNNAHAGSPNIAQGIYVNTVTYGDLSCTLTAGSCAEESCAIASLSGQTNAHVALPTGAGAYNLKLCCSSSVRCRGGGGGPVCGNGGIDGIEDCDDNGSGAIVYESGKTAACKDWGNFADDGRTVSCTASTCQVNTGGCSPIGPITDCNRFEPLMYFLPDGINQSEVLNCDDYNKNLSNEQARNNRQLTCECGNVIGGRNDPSANNAEGVSNPLCFWDTTDTKCKFSYTGVSGFCTEELPDDTVCGPDEVTKAITIETTCGTSVTNRTVEMVCPRPVQFPFFTWLNFVISMIAIFFIYAFYFRRRKKEE